MQASTTRNAEAQGPPGLVKIGEGTEPSNKATTKAKYAKAQSLRHSSTSAGTGEGLPKASGDATHGFEAEVHSTVLLSPSQEQDVHTSTLEVAIGKDAQCTTKQASSDDAGQHQSACIIG